MSKYNYSEIEQQINNVLVYQDKELVGMQLPNMGEAEKRISETEVLLQSMGYQLPKNNQISNLSEKHVMIMPSWEKLCNEAEALVGRKCELESIFTEEELKENSCAIMRLHKEYNEIYRLDKYDVSISVFAGILAAAVDVLMVGIPQKTNTGLKVGKLSDYIRAEFNRMFPEDEMEKLANSKISKVPFDAQDNRYTSEYVNGLSAYYHRLLSLGHDPLLGFVVGVFDILTGRMTTIDKTGKIVSQIMDNYADRKESNIFSALAKQILHFKSDITTSMGLPAPLMALFNLMQFGDIGAEEQTIAEIVQGMYYEGYDFIHFCSMSIPAMIVEVVVRLGYSMKCIREGKSVKDSIPLSQNKDKHPKLATMLFIGHSCAVAVNAGKVYFTKNPLAINYPQWLAFAKYSYKQLKWLILQKPGFESKYVSGEIYDDLSFVLSDIDRTFDNMSEDYIVVID